MGEDVTNAMNFNIFFRSWKFLKRYIKKRIWEISKRRSNSVIVKRLFENLGTNNLIQVVNSVEKRFAKNVIVLM